MSHDVDGFELRFTARTSWKAEVRLRGKVIGIAPVTWTKGFSREPVTGRILQTVWFHNADELARVKESREPLMVALAEAHDYAEHPHRFKRFNALYEVRPTGRIVDPLSIECEVVRRLRA